MSTATKRPKPEAATPPAPPPPPPDETPADPRLSDQPTKREMTLAGLLGLDPRALARLRIRWGMRSMRFRGQIVVDADAADYVRILLMHEAMDLGMSDLAGELRRATTGTGDGGWPRNPLPEPEQSEGTR